MKDKFPEVKLIGHRTYVCIVFEVPEELLSLWGVVSIYTYTPASDSAGQHESRL